MQSRSVEAPTRSRSWPYVVAAAGVLALAAALWFSWPGSAAEPVRDGNGRALHGVLASLLLLLMAGVLLRWTIARRKTVARLKTVEPWITEPSVPRAGSQSGSPPPVSPAFRALHALGLSGPVTVDDVKQAYRVQAAKLHPDSGGDQRAFRELQSVYREALRYAELCAGMSRPVSMGDLKLNLPREFPFGLRMVVYMVVCGALLVGLGAAMASVLPRDLIVTLIWLIGMPALGTLIGVTIAESRPPAALTLSIGVLIGLVGIWTAVLGRFGFWFRNVFTSSEGERFSYLSVDIGWMALGYATICCIAALLIGWGLNATR